MTATRTRRLVPLLGLLLLAQAPAVAAAPLAGGAPPGAVVQGRVTDPDGRAVPGASVGVFARRDGQWRQVADARTDRRGQYRIRGIRARRVLIRFAGEEWFGSRVEPWAPEWWRDATGESDATPTRLGPGRTVVRDAALVPSARLQGRVTVPGGGPAAGVRVDVEDAVTGEHVGEAGTATDGSYDVSGLAAGRYVIHLDPDLADASGVAPMWHGGAADRAGATVVAVGPSEVATGLDDELPVEARIPVVWRDSAGDPVAWPVLLQRRETGGRWVEHEVDYGFDSTQGFGGLPAGRYRLYFFRHGAETGFWWPAAAGPTGARAVVVAAGETRTVTATSAVGASISGRVTVVGARPRMVSVEVLRRGPDRRWHVVPFYDDDSETGTHAIERSDERGRYSIDGLLPGRYRLRVDGGGRTRPATTPVVRVSGRQHVRGVDVRLRRR